MNYFRSTHYFRSYCFVFLVVEISVDESAVSLRSKEQIMDEHSNSQIAEGRIVENRLAVSDSSVKNVTVMPSTKRRDDKKIMTSQLEGKGKAYVIFVHYIQKFDM